MVLQIRKRRLQKNRGVYLLLFIILGLRKESLSNCPCNNPDSMFYFHYTLDSINMQGTYWINDCSHNLIIDSARFDNTHNWNYKKIATYFDFAPRCWNQEDINIIKSNIWSIGPKIMRNPDGAFFTFTDTITGNPKYPLSFRKFSIGYYRIFYKGFLFHESFKNKEGHNLGLIKTYYESGSPERISYSGSHGNWTGDVADGPELQFHENGKIKRVALYDNANCIFDKRYNKWGIRVYKRNELRGMKKNNRDRKKKM